jgi:hypothetical protein
VNEGQSVESATAALMNRRVVLDLQVSDMNHRPCCHSQSPEDVP